MGFVTFLRSAIRFATIFLFGSTGESITERSGHLNMGVPGIMCLGSAGAAVGAKIYLAIVDSTGGNINGFLAVLFPVIFCMIFGALAGAFFSFFTVTLKSNQNVTGLALTTLGIGLYTVLFVIIGESGYTRLGSYFNFLFVSGLDGLNWFQMLFLSYGPLVYLAIILSLAAAFIIRKTYLGLTLRAVGENPAAVDAAGVDVNRYRYVATIIGSAIASLGGCFILMDYMSGQPLYNIDTYGWMAVALVIFSSWSPDIGILGSIVFSITYLMPTYMNIDSSNPIVEIISLMPYFLTIVVLVVTSIINKNSSKAPKALGLTYFREDR